ncbi:phage portal protein [Marinilactibacillus sp. GCM10026970]|uniref:phage portal protein n=1 Tax=Marinilactibacillus sp. GCM10026970 TaxID=3252642 RepID=UPI00360DD73C
MDSKYLLSDNPEVVARGLKHAIKEDKVSQEKEKARVGQNYYDYKHDILNHRIFYIDDNDRLVEDTMASNIKIPHPFFTEQVDQKVQYLLSNPLELEVEDEVFKERLEEYYNDDTQLFLQETLEGSSIKGFEYAYARTNADDRLCFQVSDSLQTFDVYDDDNVRMATVRYYNKDIYRDGKNTSVEFAEIWDSEKVTFFVEDKNKNFRLDDRRELNPRPHVVAITDDGKLLQRDMGTIPFYRLSNNKKERTDLEPIKPLIDDYDLMACFLSNNLQDFAEAIYVVRGFRGDDLSKLRKNIKAKKTVGVSSDGGVDIRTIEIPVEARKTKLGIDKEAIYHFGMAFDSTQVADSNGTVTNVAIQSGYSLLNMKCNKAETRLRTLLSWMNELIVADINRRYGTSYKTSDIEMTITRETVVNQAELAEIEKMEAETKEVIIQSILAASSKLDDESTLKMICEQFDLDFDEVQKQIEEQEYLPGIQANTDPIEGDEDESVEQVAARA